MMDSVTLPCMSGSPLLTELIQGFHGQEFLVGALMSAGISHFLIYDEHNPVKVFRVCGFRPLRSSLMDGEQPCDFLRGGATQGGLQGVKLYSVGFKAQ